MKSPTGRINNLQPEMQELRRRTTVAGHSAAMAAIDFGPLELRIMAHQVDEYQSWATHSGVSPEEAMQILDEEVEKQKSSPEWIDVFDRARRRILDRD